MDSQNHNKEEDLIRTMIMASANLSQGGSSKFTPMKKNTMEASKN